jgi:hypothetical protein
LRIIDEETLEAALATPRWRALRRGLVALGLEPLPTQRIGRR